MTPSPGIKPGTHWWKASAPTTGANVSLPPPIYLTVESERRTGDLKVDKDWSEKDTGSLRSGCGSLKGGTYHETSEGTGCSEKGTGLVSRG